MMDCIEIAKIHDPQKFRCKHSGVLYARPLLSYLYGKDFLDRTRQAQARNRG